MKERKPAKLRELAFYYPNPVWSYGDWIKSLVLFFDGIALLVPNYMKRRPEEIDPAIVAGLKQHGLLEIIKRRQGLDPNAPEGALPRSCVPLSDPSTATAAWYSTSRQ